MASAEGPAHKRQHLVFVVDSSLENEELVRIFYHSLRAHVREHVPSEKLRSEWAQPGESRGTFDDDFSELLDLSPFIFLECNDVTQGSLRVVLEENAVTTGHNLKTKPMEEHFCNSLCEDSVSKNPNYPTELVD